MNNDILTNRHDILVLFEVTNGNPNGDPDAGNMPRIEPNSNRGLVSDVCLKRKVRNYVAEFGQPDEERKEDDNGFALLIRQGAVLNNEIGKGIEAATKSLAKAPKDVKQKAVKDWLCREFYDVRAFGGVLSTGDELMKGSAWGQVRGPVQFTFGQSFHPTTPIEITVTRCAVTKEEDAASERTMGHKHIVPYALYAAKCFISPSFAEKDKGTGFTNADLALFFKALNNLFAHDHSAARGDMIMRGIYDFEHVGTQPEGKNEVQNKKEARLGCAHAHVLLEGIEVRLKKNADGTDKECPQSFADYEIVNHWDSGCPGSKKLGLPLGVKLHLRHLEPMWS